MPGLSRFKAAFGQEHHLRIYELSRDDQELISRIISIYMMTNNLIGRKTVAIGRLMKTQGVQSKIIGYACMSKANLNQFLKGSLHFSSVTRLSSVRVFIKATRADFSASVRCNLAGLPSGFFRAGAKVG